MVAAVTILLVGPAVLVQFTDNDAWFVARLRVSPIQIQLLLGAAVLTTLLLRHTPFVLGRSLALAMSGRLLAALLLLPFAAIHAFALIPTAIATPLLTKIASLLIVAVVIFTYPPVAADRLRNARELISRVLLLAWTFAAVTFMAVVQSVATSEQKDASFLLDRYGELAVGYVSIPLAVSMILVIAGRERESNKNDVRASGERSHV
jgi:hypothetical protein